ncbi:MFS general substrate transporter [Xylariaceae sp. AK1471]|nr:MFS general substrate transporter [Xylariaceae sp. AK1471]
MTESAGSMDIRKPDMATHDEKLEAQHIEFEAHRQYLIERHGTATLDPLPEFTDADPYNWPQGKKLVNLLFVAFHAFMSTFTAAAIQSAFVNIAMDLDVSIQQASYLTSLVIAVLGVAPLFWRPLSGRFGRRPIFLISLVGSLVANVGCAKSPTYSTMALCRAIAAFFISPAAAIGSAVVQEMYFSHQRGYYMGIWTMFVTLGVPVAPFIFGFVALRVGYRWIYWTLAITNAVHLILYFLLSSESRYVRGQEKQEATTSYARNLLRFRRIDRTPITVWDFAHPLRLAVFPCVLVPAVAYAVTFNLASVFPTIEIPQLYVELFELNTQEVGLQNLAVIIGTVLGEQIGGFCSDRWMKRRRGSPAPEFRLWLTYSGYALVIGGVTLFLVQLQNAGHSYNVTPTVGAGIAAAGNQIVTTVLVTYAVDCHREEAAAIGVFITFVRQIWGFIGPFWFPSMIESVGLGNSSGIVAALIVGVSVLGTVLLQLKGSSWR